LPSSESTPPVATAKPKTPDGTRIYAIGDVHGRADLLKAVFERIDTSLTDHPIEQAVQVLLGDYIDRGPESRDVIDLLIARRRQHAMVCLKGNHEIYPVRFLSDSSMLSEWAQVGGINTLLSYGARPSTRDDPKSEKDVARDFQEALPENHNRFFRSLALSFTCGDYFFAHAGVRPGIPLNQQREQDLLLIRDSFLWHEGGFGKTIVHGHSPVKEPDFRPNRINIDTGAYATGRLTCLVLQGDQAVII
jgi:serine/threonine protein phosphatase 1